MNTQEHRGRKHRHTQRSRKPSPVESTGTIRINTRGFGYIAAAGGPTEDIEVPPELLNTALHLDTVTVVPHPKRHQGRLRGEVVEVQKRAKTRFVGTIEEEDGFFFVRPDDMRVYVDFILERSDTPVPVGQKVAVDLIRWSSPKKNPLARLVEVLGPAGEHETEMRSIVSGQGFDWHFSEDVLKESENIHQNADAFFATEVPKRRDFRTVPTFTIDPSDAKDFDDAISIRELPNGRIEIGVHIADVSAYLQPESPMDREAQKRGTSIYLVDRTIPMLPEVLSNDLCSLVPERDRLAMSAVFEMSIEGDVHHAWYGETVIHSNRRFSYQQAQDILTAGRGELHRELLTADTIARNLREARFRNGSIGFETDEIKFELDEQGKPVRAYRKQRLDTMLMIEDLMLLANREVATWMHEEIKKKKRGTFVWRVHDTPKAERIEDLALFLTVLGYDLPHKNGMVTARDLNALFAQVAGKPEQDMIETATIRSMAKAVYSTKNIGHFGLAFPFYTHFTSPIRRYPDVMVHRIVKMHLRGASASTQDFPWYERLCTQSTEREIAAMEAERDSIKLKQVEYMAGRIGESFEGVISGINDWGIFVEEQETMAEGLVRTREMRDDFYELKDHGFRLVGTRTGKTYSLGDRVNVRLKKVDIEQKTIDWELV